MDTNYWLAHAETLGTMTECINAPIVAKDGKMRFMALENETREPQLKGYSDLLTIASEKQSHIDRVKTGDYILLDGLITPITDN